MSDNRILSKFEQLKSILIDEIESGDYHGDDKFPSENVLADKYRIGRSTVREALSSLVHEGRLYRIQGKGTFIAARNAVDQMTCALFIRTAGHFYERQSGHLIRQLQTNGFFTFVVDQEGFGRTVKQQVAFFRDLLAKGVSTFIIDGFYSFPVRALERLGDRELDIVFINRCEHAFKGRASYVLSDPFQGLYCSTSHLIGRGRRNILYITFDPKDIRKQCGLNYDYDLSDHRKFLAGYEKAVEEHGLKPLVFYKENGVKGLSKLLKEQRPDGIVAFADYLIRDVLQGCAEVGMTVPHNLEFIGYYNTPWMEMAPVPIGSVSICEERIVDEVVSILLNRGGDCRKVVIEPELIIK